MSRCKAMKIDGINKLANKVLNAFRLFDLYKFNVNNMPNGMTNSATILDALCQFSMASISDTKRITHSILCQIAVSNTNMENELLTRLDGKANIEYANNPKLIIAGIKKSKSMFNKPVLVTFKRSMNEMK